MDFLSRQISDRDHFSSFVNVEDHVLAVVHQFAFLRVVLHFKRKRRKMPAKRGLA